MKSLLALFLFLTMGTLYADEIVSLKAIMLLKRCDISIHPGECTIEMNFPKTINVELKMRDLDKSELGEIKFNRSQDDFNIDGTISVTKLIEQNRQSGFVYCISADFSYNKTGTDDTQKVTNNLGYVFASDLNKLNEISWFSNVIKQNNITLQYQIIVAPPNSNFISTQKL